VRNRESILLDQFGIDTRIRTIAIVGAGGKTSLMYRLAQEILGQGRTVVSTTTTKILVPSPFQSPCLLTLAEDPQLGSLSSSLSQFRHISLGRDIVRATGKLDGIGDDTVEACLEVARHVVVEADGARGRSIKAPEKWEPVIPRQADLVVAMVGLDSLGKPVTEENVFRLERFVSITGLQRGDIITSEAVAILLSHQLGGLKGVKGGVNYVPFLNKVDLVEDPRWTEETARYILGRDPKMISRVVTGSLLLGISTFRTFHLQVHRSTVSNLT
jgi:probable selenium-dependent hydroxylase accessory protein YqeC